MTAARDKMRLCPKCGCSLDYIDKHGYCCSRGHGCWWPKGEEKVVREQQGAIYAGGALKLKGNKKSGKKRKKKVPAKLISESYLLD